MLEQRRDRLHNSPASVFKPCLVAFDSLDTLKLEVAFGIIFVGGTNVIGEWLQTARRKHLHHH